MIHLRAPYRRLIACGLLVSVRALAQTPAGDTPTNNVAPAAPAEPPQDTAPLPSSDSAETAAVEPTPPAMQTANVGAIVQPSPEARVSAGGGKTFANFFGNARAARCRTAICGFGADDTWFAVEPLGEIPVGKTFVFPGVDSGLADFVQNHDVSVTLAAGLRFWFFYDWVSLSVYLSSPLYDGDATIRLRGSDFEHSPARLKRPYPGVGLGLIGDLLWIGVDYNELRNGDTDASRDPDFARNAVISRAWTISFGLAPITLARSGLGSVGGSANADDGTSKK
jgi:hypothetical protein